MEQDRQTEDIVNELYDGQIILNNKTSNKDSVRMKYAQSYYKSMTGSASHEEEFEQSEVMEKDSVEYQAMEYSDTNANCVNNLFVDQNRRMSDPVSVVGKELAESQVSFFQPFQIPIIGTKNEQLAACSNHDDMFDIEQGPHVKQQKSERNEKEQKEEKLLSDVREGSVMEPDITKKLQYAQSSVKNQIQTLYIPPYRNLPFTLIIEEKSDEVEAIIPCVFANASPSIHQASDNKESSVQSHKTDQGIQNNFQLYQMTKSQVQEESQSESEKLQCNQAVTDVLLQRVNQLSIKVKKLQNQKRNTEKTEKIVRDTKLCYSTTKSIQLQSSGRRGNSDYRLFSTTSSTQTKIPEKLQQQKHLTKCMIVSNTLSLKLAGKLERSIVDQIQLLKQKLDLLERKQLNVIDRTSQQIEKGKEKEKVHGVIIRRRGFNRAPSPADTSYFHKNREQMNEGSMESKQPFYHSKDFEYEQKRLNFLQNPVPIIQSSIGMHNQNQNQFKDREISLSQQALVAEKSHDFKFENQQTDPAEPIALGDFQVPELNVFPSSQSSLEDLVSIGRLAFEKFGCPIDSDSPLKVKKYKNCVHLKLMNFNILWHFDRKLYFGGWKYLHDGEGEKAGEGIEYVPGKYKYKGNFEKGKRCGFGKLFAENGTVYVGQWLNGLKHGRGTFIQGDGLQYKGDWQLGHKNGKGIILLNSRIQFQGSFKENMKNGFGKEFFQNGDYYEGQYKSNKFHGKGKYIWKSKASYNGDFQQGKRHGNGLWRSAQTSFDQYEGHYFEDNKNGHGQYQWSNGAIYNGNFKNDLKHGEGIMSYPSGKIVKMNWTNGHASKGKSLTRQNTSANLNCKTERKNIISRSSQWSKLSRASLTNTNANLEAPKGISYKKDHQLPRDQCSVNMKNLAIVNFNRT